MRYTRTLIAVRDMERSRKFYCGLLGMEVTAEFGDNITLSDCIALQTIESWTSFLEKPETEIVPGGNAAELYFEEADIDAFLRKLAAYPDVRYVHPLKEHGWGQRVVRFYDPDFHIIEVGEAMSAVTRRFRGSGMTPEEIAVRMSVPREAVLHWLKEKIFE